MIPSSFNDDAGDDNDDDAIDDDEIFAAFMMPEDCVCVFELIGVGGGDDGNDVDDVDGGIDNREVVVAVTLVEFLERGGGRIDEEVVVFDKRFKLDGGCLYGSDVRRAFG